LDFLPGEPEEKMENRIIQILMEKGLTRSLAKKMCAEFFYTEIKNIAEQPPKPDNFGDYLLENDSERVQDEAILYQSIIMCERGCFASISQPSVSSN
jgi:hypothetical protein